MLALKQNGIKGMGFVYGMYKDWCKAVNCKCYSQILFAKKIKDHVYHKHKKDGEYYKCWKDDDIPVINVPTDKKVRKRKPITKRVDDSDSE